MIFVFKTSANTKTQVKKVKPHINNILPEGKWNFDIEDCDKILRIDSEENIVLTILNLPKNYNFLCE